MGEVHDELVVLYPELLSRRFDHPGIRHLNPSASIPVHQFAAVALLTRCQGDAQLDRWINSLDLNASETTQEQIAENFENLKAEIEQNAMFPNSVNKIAEITGMEASQVEATMRASGLDPEKLPNPPDAKVAEFLNTLESSEGYQAGKEDFNNALRELKTKIAEKMGEASTLNQSNAASDTSILDNTDTSSFKFLWDAKNHQDEYSQKVLDAAKTLTEKRVDILNALYDGDVKADASNPENLGGITFKGTSMNIIDGTSGEAKFSNTQVKWPEIELPKYFVDADDDGAYLGPPWMKDANYPTYVYDPD